MKFKQFQLQDYARAALHDGIILAHDTGLGKGIAAFAWPLLKCGWTVVHDRPGDPSSRRIKPNAPILLVVPGDLHAQMIEEGWNKFRIRVNPITCQEDFRRLTRLPGSQLTRCTSDGRPIVPPDFYITSYTQLTTNGVAKRPDVADWSNPLDLLKELALPIGDHQPTIQETKWPFGGGIKDSPGGCDAVTHFFAWRKARWSDDYYRLQVDPDGTLSELEENYTRRRERLAEHPDVKWRDRELTKLDTSYGILKNLLTTRRNPTFASLANEQQRFVVASFLELKLADWSAGTGETAHYDLVAQDGLKPVWQKPNPAASAASSVASTLPLKRLTIKCVYSPSLSDESYNAFDCVTIDEGVKIKGDDTLVGMGVRQMDPKYRCVLTATPVKNRLTDIFHLAWWAAGAKLEAHARFPFRVSEKGVFAQTFMVSEANLSKMAEAETNDKKVNHSRYTKLTAEVCNVHRLWKLLGPLVLRRRKDDCNEDIVPKIRRVIRCEMGTMQQKVYSYHLQADYLDINQEPAIAAQLQALRVAAADPSSKLLEPRPGDCTEPCRCSLKPVPEDIYRERLQKELSALHAQTIMTSGPRQQMKKEARERQMKIEDIEGRLAKPVQTYDPIPPDKHCRVCHGEGRLQLPPRASSAYVPKMATTLTLIEEILARQEQVVVFSAFNDPLDRLSEWLHEAQVRHVKLDGRTSQKKRGELAAIFKRGRYTHDAVGRDSVEPACPVMLAGVECMAEGHSFHLANNVILIAYSWAYDKFIQAINRVHRMTSAKPVNVYVVICTGTIDRKLESLIQDKGDAAELVLDGRLIGERTDEINLAELLNIAQREFDTRNNTIDEAMLAAQWPALRDKLKAAMTRWTHEAPVLQVGRAVPCAPVAKPPIRPLSPTNYPPVVRRIKPATKPENQKKETDMPKYEVYHNSPLAAVLPPGTIITAPEVVKPAAKPAALADWKAQMAERAEKLKKLLKPKADVWRDL